MYYKSLKKFINFHEINIYIVQNINILLFLLDLIIILLIFIGKIIINF